MSATPSLTDTPSEVKSEGSENGESPGSPNYYALSSARSSDSFGADSSSSEQRTTTGTCRKRKHLTPTGRKLKRIRTRYNDQYRQLLNETIGTVAGPGESKPIGDEPVLARQHGVSWWTSDEKLLFFHMLARKGESDIRAIALAIGTKSEIEVHVYLQSIRKALETRLRRPRPRLLSLVDLPAAVEVSEECCLALDQHAQILGLLQQNHEEKVEQDLHSDFWLLTQDTARRAQKHIIDDGSGEASIVDKLPALSLLNLSKWLLLSERVFMNSGSPREGENWRVITEDMEKPSITNTAFSDFYTLAISVTKRLIQSSLFYAMSRLRATDSSRYRHRPVVRARDVKTAVQVLGMKATTFDFWTTAPRRCRLHVYEDSGKKRRVGKLLNYEEAERTLTQAKVGDQDYEQADLPICGEMESKHTEHEPNEGLLSTDSGGATSEEGEYGASCQVSDYNDSSDSNRVDWEDRIDLGEDGAARQLRAQRRLERDEDQYVEEFDRHASLAEEQRLWAMLGETPESNIKPEDSNSPPRPRSERTLGNDFVNWRDRVEFWSEWEMFKKPVPPERFRRLPSKTVMQSGRESYESEAASNNEYYGMNQTGVTENRAERAVDNRVDTEDAAAPGRNHLPTKYTLTDSASDDLQDTSDASWDEASAVNARDRDAVVSSSHCADEDPSLPPVDHSERLCNDSRSIPASNDEESESDAEMPNSTPESEGRSFCSSEPP
ncbi:hypothetical protein MMC16_007263 [Acarospora aff. strigata]|nr:hypothetical protein [Acarospora aff. strigata]